jgi:hypothetical protein
MRGTNATPERVYQFPGVQNSSIQAGSQVAISSQFLAFPTRNPLSAGPGSSLQDSVFVARNNNGNWGACPVVNSQPNCIGAVRENGVTASKALTRIPLTYTANHWEDIGLVLSDNNLVISYKLQSRVEFYHYNAQSDRWDLEVHMNEPTERFTGQSLAIDGDTVAVGSPWTNGKFGQPLGQELGSVRVVRRDASGIWNIVSSTYGYFTLGGFGMDVALSSGNLVVRSSLYNEDGAAADESFTFFGVAADGSISAPLQLIQPSQSHRHLALSGDTFAAALEYPGDALAVYKRDPSSGAWVYSAGLNGEFYRSTNSPTTPFGYRGLNPIALAGKSDRKVPSEFSSKSRRGTQFLGQLGEKRCKRWRVDQLRKSGQFCQHGMAELLTRPRQYPSGRGGAS